MAPVYTSEHPAALYLNISQHKSLCVVIVGLFFPLDYEFLETWTAVPGGL